MKVEDIGFVAHYDGQIACKADGNHIEHVQFSGIP